MRFIACASLHALLAMPSDKASFVIGFVLSNLAFGMVWLLIGELFGTAHMSANYNFYNGQLLAGGTLLLSKVVAQEVCKRHVNTEVADAADHHT